MTTDFATGSVPSVYREIFDLCSRNGEPVEKDIFECLLAQSNLEAEVLKVVWELAVASQEINRTRLYKALALVAWAQQGKSLSSKLFDNFTGNEYPIPKLNDLLQVKNLKLEHNLKSNPSVLGLCYSDITQFDTNTVELVPEKKGIFLKHSEYIVTSRRHNSKVTRRYNDFVALHELLLSRFPYRLVPRLPPKKIVSDSCFLESRRRGLQRWLTLVCRHPVMCHDSVVAFFLTDQGPELQYRIRNIYRKQPDEFMTSDIAATAKQYLPSDFIELASSREQIRSLVQTISKMKQLADASVERMTSYSHDSEDFSTQLRSLGSLEINDSSGSKWNDTRKKFLNISREFLSLSNKTQQHANLEQITVCERLGLLHDILTSHRDLCERLEKGLAQDHQSALGKMLSLKKRKIQGVIKGTDAESVEQLEAKMLAQESVITNMEHRSDFSLYCVHMETQLVHCYLETLEPVLRGLVSLRIRSHSELAEIWKNIQPMLETNGNAVNGQSNVTSRNVT